MIGKDSVREGVMTHISLRSDEWKSTSFYHATNIYRNKKGATWGTRQEAAEGREVWINLGWGLVILLARGNVTLSPVLTNQYASENNQSTQRHNLSWDAIFER